MREQAANEAVSARAFAAGTLIWHSESGEQVAYVDTGSAWVAVGSPLAAHERRAATGLAFCEAARVSRRRACFVGVEDESWCQGLARLALGAQPIFIPSAWRDALPEHRRLREQLRRARAKGVVVTLAAAADLEKGMPLRTAVDAVAREWLASRRMEPLGFVIAVDPFRRPTEQRYFVAHVGNRLVAFASVAPTASGQGWLVEDVLRTQDAPNGTTEVLLNAVCETCPEGFTLGLAPLAGSALWQRVTRAVARPLYDFDGIARFKQRLHPQSWQPVWLVAAPDVSVWLALVDCLRAFAHGPLWRFAARTLLRRAGGIPYVLAVPLVPWTMFLYALAMTSRAGPLDFSGSTLVGFAAFNTVLIAGMFAAAYRPRLRLLLLLLAAAALDASVLLTQATHLGLGTSAMTTLLRCAAITAPVVATFALAWSARLTRERVRR